MVAVTSALCQAVFAAKFWTPHGGTQARRRVSGGGGGVGAASRKCARTCVCVSGVCVRVLGHLSVGEQLRDTIGPKAATGCPPEQGLAHVGWLPHTCRGRSAEAVSPPSQFVSGGWGTSAGSRSGGVWVGLELRPALCDSEAGCGLGPASLCTQAWGPGVGRQPQRGPQGTMH